MSTLSVDRARDALIVVDLQPDFMPGGPLAVAGGDEIAAPIGRLARRFACVVATQDFHPAGHASFASSHPGKRPFEQIVLHGATQTLWPDHCVAGSDGARLHPALPDESIALVLRKGTRADVDSYSAFRENPGPDGTRPPTGLAGWLRERGIARLFVVGLARDFCVRWTALDGAAAGFAVVLLDDLTRAVDPQSRATVDEELTAAGVSLASAAEIA
jgi:nicotinamidase/pyrazinamidase